MNLDDIISAGESETVEFKETWSEDCIKALASFANTRGGRLIVGVRDSGEVVGWRGDGREQEGVATQITSLLHVHPMSMTVEELAGNAVLVIQMARAASAVPVRGRYYRRVLNTTQEVPAEELARFLLERTGQTWDAITGDFGLETLADKSIADFRAMAGARLPALSPSDSVETVLANLRLSSNGRLLRAAQLLFGKDPQRFTPSAQVQIGRFGDGGTILDDRRVEGNLFVQLDELTRILRDYFLVRYEIPEDMSGREGIQSLQREEVWEYPLSALREAVINALVHRDYTSTGRVQIRAYADRVVISNPGGLPEGITVNDLLREPHPSLPRNPVLAQIFYYANLVEQWGSGTVRMIRACRAQGLPDPEFDSSATEFAVTFRSGRVSVESLRRLGFSERQIRGVQYVTSQGSISNMEYQEIAGVRRRTAARDLEQLEERGILRRSTPVGRRVRYILPDSNVPNVTPNVS